MFKSSVKTAMNVISDGSVNNRDDISDTSNGLDVGSDDIENSASSFAKSRLNLEWNDSQATETNHSDDPIDELSPENVRWFYKNFSDKLWTEFNGYDSLRIENRYRRLTELELKYFSNSVRNLKPSSISDRSANSSPVPFDSPKKLISPDSAKKTDYIQGQEYSPTSEVCDRVVVRGGLYEVDLLQRTCASIFWPGEECVITRGSWFFEANWQPLDLETCDILERAHLSLFQGKRNSDYVIDAKSPKRVLKDYNGESVDKSKNRKHRNHALHSEVFVDYNVDWYAPHEVYMFSKATPTKIVRSFTQKLGGYFQKSTGSKIFRGYKDVATDVDRPKDITHLVFVVHGIGQKMDIGGRILHNTALLRQTVVSLHQKCFPSSSERAEFFPVEWRMSLTLDGGLVEAITPMNVVPLRNFLNSSAMDIMYYTSPIYSAEIQQGVINELNRLYTLFKQRNPNMNTKVSVVAHSLGCIIVYDIITGWLPQGPHVDSNCRKDLDLSGKSRLKFHVDNFFCLGSPLAVFLALRFPRGQHGYHLFPPSLCNRLYNIFHLSDPVAYRLEPLVIREYCKIAPLQIRAHNAVSRTPYCDMPLELILSQDKDKEKDSSANSTPIPTPKDEASVSPPETPVRDRGWSIWSLVRGGHKSQEGTSSPQQMDSPTQGLEHRLDYVLRSSSVGISYWSAMTSHTGYWSNPDVAYFILTQIFPALEETTESNGVNSSLTLPNSNSFLAMASGGPTTTLNASPSPLSPDEPTTSILKKESVL